jgi:hypothetical protein
MATKIKIVTAKDFFKVTPEGVIDMSTSKQLLIDIAKAERIPADYDLLVDFRDSRWKMSTMDIYELASQLCEHGDTFRGRVALLVLPGTDFDAASFLMRSRTSKQPYPGFCPKRIQLTKITCRTNESTHTNQIARDLI